jgi:hypothetical protein
MDLTTKEMEVQLRGKTASCTAAEGRSVRDRAACAREGADVALAGRTREKLEASRGGDRGLKTDEKGIHKLGDGK